MDASELRSADVDVTRNTVLKSLVAVMTLVRANTSYHITSPLLQPLFGLAEGHLQSCMAALFAQRDFSDIQLLTGAAIWCMGITIAPFIATDLYASFNHTLHARASLDDQYLLTGLSARPLVRLFGRKVLSIVKLLLLGRRCVHVRGTMHA